MMTAIYITAGAVTLLGLLVMAGGGWYVVREQTRSIVQRLGRHVEVSEPGLHFKFPLITRVAENISLRLIELPFEVDTPTKDEAFVKVRGAIHYLIVNPYDAFYKMESRKRQLQSMVADLVRGVVPDLTLAEAFSDKEKIQASLQSALAADVQEYGLELKRVLITDVEPDQAVRSAMNDRKASEARLEATQRDAEATKLRKVKEAEADADAKELQGKGVAAQRIEIAKGVQESADLIRESLGEDAQGEVMNVLLMTQYFDTLTALADKGASKVIFLTHEPAGMQQISAQIRKGMMGADAATDVPVAPADKS